MTKNAYFIISLCFGLMFVIKSVVIVTDIVALVLWGAHRPEMGVHILTAMVALIGYEIFWSASGEEE